MGKGDDTRPSKLEKPSSPPQDQANIHAYPDWAAMQAYYGPRVPVPPYFNSAVASGQAAHPYMWGQPQHIMPPYGAPYAAIYAHGGVYAHPGVPLAGIPYMQTPSKSSGHKDHGLMKKLKGFDGLAMSLGNSNPNSAEVGANYEQSQSVETEISSDRSNGNTSGAGDGRKRSHEKTSTLDAIRTGEDGKPETQNSRVPVTGVNGEPNVLNGVDGSPNTDKAVTLAIVPQPCALTPNDAWLQNERELKRERRKQSNRESARRSRMRRQAEAAELAVKVESLNADNMQLKSEINRLTENSEKLKLENTTLIAKMKNDKGQTEAVNLTKLSKKKVPADDTENLLSRVNNAVSVGRSDERGEMCDANSKSGAKLHQLMDASPMADAVVAG